MTKITWADKSNARNTAKDVVNLIVDYATEVEPDAFFVVHVNERLSSESLEWSMMVTSPRGRKHYNIIQRKPYGSVCFTLG